MRVPLRFLTPVWLRACAVVLIAAATAPAGDSVVAKTLLENGKKAVNAKKYDEAVTLLKKALQEDPALAESAYWIAVAREKSKDDTGALAGYRDFLAILDRKGAAVTAEEKKLRPQAEKRVDALAGAERDFQKLEDRFVEELLAFAREKRAKDPAAALAAVEQVLRVRPRHEEGLAIRKALDPSAVEDGPFDRVQAWTDFIEKELLSAEGLTQAGGVVTVDCPKGRRYKPASTVDLGKDYALEGEFRILNAYEQRWMCGVCFGEDRETTFVFTANRAGASIDIGRQTDGRAGITNLAVRALEALDTASWHRIGVVVRGRLVQGWLDGQMVLEHQVSERPDLAGIPGLMQQGCKVEWRKIRAGRL